MNLLKKYKTDVDEYQKNCDEHQSQLNSIQPQIENLKPQLLSLEQQLDTKEKELQQKKEERKLASPDDKKRLQAEIDKLQEERIEIAKQIRQVNLAINNLKTNQEYYQDLLGRAEKLKKDLEQKYTKTQTEYRNEILKSLNSLYEITPTEG